MNGYKIVLLKAILCFIGCRKVNGYAPEYVFNSTFALSLFRMILIIRYLHVFEWLGDYLETSLLILCFLWYTRKLKREEDDYFRGEIYLQWESKIMYLSLSLIHI